MVQSTDGSYLYLAGLNRIYQLNASTMKPFDEVQTGPVDGVNDRTMFLAYEGRSLDDSHYLLSCGTAQNMCYVRDSDNITVTVLNITYPIRLDDVAAFLVDFEGSRYLFVACPHNKTQNINGMRCREPGIFLFSKKEKFESSITGKWTFISYEEAKVITKKFVAAFPVSQHRLFFSVQQNKMTGQTYSRVSQICQKEALTDYTYVDMPMKCKNLTVLKSVQKIFIPELNVTHIVTVFSNEEDKSSAICVYRFHDIKSR